VRVSAVIRQSKRGPAPPPETGNPLFSFADLERQAREILARAHTQANQLVSDATTRAAEQVRQLHAEGYQRGLTEGRQRGLEEVQRQARQSALHAAQAELKQLGSALASGLAEYQRQRHGLIAQAESGLIELAVAIARRVCKVHLEASVEPVRANVRALLDMVAPQAPCDLCVSPTDYERLKEVLPELIQQTAQFEHVTLKPDPQVPAGGCVLHTHSGLMDASVEAQLDRIAAAITEPTAGLPCDRAEVGSP
jgi:flagellar assembly protein FliH